MSLHEVPTTTRHTVEVPLPLAKLSGSSTTTTPIQIIKELDLPNAGSARTYSASSNITRGIAFTNNQSNDSEVTNAEWSYINVLNPFDPLKFETINTYLNAETSKYLEVYDRFRVMGLTAKVYFFNTPDIGHDTGTRLHLPLIFGVNSIFTSQHRHNPSVLTWHRRDDTATVDDATNGAWGFNVNDYLTYKEGDYKDVCVGGGWRTLKGHDPPAIFKWNRFAHYYDQSKFDKEWGEILFNNTTKCNHAPGKYAATPDQTSNAYKAAVPFNTWSVDGTPTLITQTGGGANGSTGELPIYWQPYALAPGHLGLQNAGSTSNHPSIDAAYRVVLEYDVEFSEPTQSSLWLDRVLIQMDDADTLMTNDENARNDTVMDQSAQTPSGMSVANRGHEDVINSNE